MTANMRWRWGDTDPRECRVESAHAIEIGDLLYLDTDSVRKVSDLGILANAGAAQEAVHDDFVGVAMQRHVAGAGVVTKFRVATKGVFEFTTPTSTFEMGALVGVDDDGGTTFVPQDQAVETIVSATGTDEGKSIGRCARRVTSADVVLVAIKSTVYHGGEQAAAT